MLPFFTVCHGQQAGTAERGRGGGAGDRKRKRLVVTTRARFNKVRTDPTNACQAQQKTDHLYPAAWGRIGARRISVLAAVVPGLRCCEARNE